MLCVRHPMARKSNGRKSKPRTRSRRAFNIGKAAEMYLSTNVLTQNFAGVNPLSFFTGMEYGNIAGSGSGLSRPATKMGFAYVPNNATVTMPELLGFGTATVGQGTQRIADNFKANAFNAAIQYAGVKIGFKIGSKLLRSQRSFINNDILKPLLGKNMVRV
tara:strand:+ start:2639 stop:3121 length:483 start_codon:yes stop_codon:yes gene_type:complete